MTSPSTLYGRKLFPPDRAQRIIVSSVSSDSHTWNLVYLQLLLEELGHEVLNLGACVPDDLLVRESLSHRPDLIVISSVNGHGFLDGRRLIARLRREPGLEHLPVVIGGKLGTEGAAGPDHQPALLAAGFTAVFTGDDAVGAFRSSLRLVPAATSPAPAVPAGAAA